MKVNVFFNGILVGAKEKPYTMQNGQQGTSYSLALEHCDDVGNVKCSKDVYALVRSGAIPKYSECECHGVYDTDYRNMSIEGLNSAKKQGTK